MKIYQVLARKILARKNCIDSGNTEWKRKHEAFALAIVKEYAPSGGGFDSGTRIDLEECDENKLVFSTSFHHMNGNGYYDGWTNHSIYVGPSLAFGYNVKIKGIDKNGIKEYIHEAFFDFLGNELDENAFYEKHKGEID